MNYGVGCRRGSDLLLLWLWHRPAATAPIRPLAWESPYATGAALEKDQKKKKKKFLFSGVPDIVQWKRIQLGTMRLRVQSLALFSELRIWP